MNDRDVAYILREVTKRLLQVEGDCQKLVEFLKMDAPVDFCFRLSCMVGTLNLCKDMLHHFGED